MTDREKEILNAINEMGLFRTPYPNDEVSRLVSKLIKDKVAELEKIKSETVEKYKSDRFMDNYTMGVFHKVLDNHIKELKGENK